MLEMFNAPVDDVDDMELIICWYPDIDNGSYGDGAAVVFIELFRLSSPLVHQSWYVELVWLWNIK